MKHVHAGGAVHIACLRDVSSGKLQATYSMGCGLGPWSRDQGKFIFYGSNHNSSWMRVVIASGLAESASVGFLGSKYQQTGVLWW